MHVKNCKVYQHVKKRKLTVPCGPLRTSRITFSSLKRGEVMTKCVYQEVKRALPFISEKARFIRVKY